MELLLSTQVRAAFIDFGSGRAPKRRSFSCRALEHLKAAGVAVWLDDLSLERLTSGSLTRLVGAGDIVGITTNPTIIAKSISAGAGYEAQIKELALRDTAIGEALRPIAGQDVRGACDVLRPVFEPPGIEMVGCRSGSIPASRAMPRAPPPKRTAFGG